MAKTIKLTASDGTTVEFVDEIIGSGAMKDVYFSPDKSYVVGFFRTPLDVRILQAVIRTKYSTRLVATIGRKSFVGQKKWLNGMER